MRHRFGKGYRNVLYTHPLSREKRRLSISNSIAIRKSMGLPVGRASKLHNRNGKTYDLVKSAAATFFKPDHRFYSEGDVEVTLDIPEEGAPQRTLVSIQSYGVTFDTATGRVETDQPAHFIFSSGSAPLDSG